MARKKTTSAPVLRASGNCEVSDYLAQRIWEEGISMPEGITLRFHFVSDITGWFYADHPLSRFYENQTSLVSWASANRAKGFYQRREERMKANILALTTRELRDFVNSMRTSVRNFINIARIDHLFEISDAHRTLPADLRHLSQRDDQGKPLAPIGFDTVFLRLAEERGVSQREVEDAIWAEIRRLKARANAASGQPSHGPALRSDTVQIVRSGFSNLSVDQLRAQFGSHYRNMNTLFDPVLQRLAPFNGCIWGAKPLATDVIIGDWIYKSSVTPTLMSTRSIPESIRQGLKGQPVNALVDTPVFGDTQTIIHVAELKNGKTIITMTPETVPYEGRGYASQPSRLAA